MNKEIVQENFFLDSSKADILQQHGARATFLSNGSIDLGNEKYFLSLLSANIVFNEPNVKEGKNNMFYWVDPDTIPHSYAFENGLYSIEQINDEIMQLMIDLYGSENAYQFIFKADTATGKCTVQFRNFSGWSLDCTKTNNILAILGFTTDQGLITATKYNQIIDSKSNIMLNSLRNYIVTCNLVSDSFLNSNRSNAISQFTPNAEPFSQYTYEPLHLSHLGINRVSKIDKVIITFLNQEEQYCDFTGGSDGIPESWTVRLRLCNVITN